ncbi:uncharacterized protein LOC132192882 [Neocloeon triangulifer]|uniref:uncharacterized protein LOC132192882 n=1 Tax=Neocloeon triangulifer TaxID=2078957 RepID=UPI00286F004A|nr:uncharacterized protein LOC132192882 [Neocloeon triangulifer]
MLCASHSLFLLTVAAVCSALPSQPREDENVVAVVSNCMKRDANFLVTCLQERAVKAWDQALSTNAPFEMFDGMVSLEKDPASNTTDVQAVDLTGTSSMDDLPSDPGARSFQLNNMLIKKLTKFLQTRTLKIIVPLSEEGRGKLKKYAEPLAMAIMWKMMMAALAMGALALLAGKALIVSKLALTLSLLLAVRRVLNGGGVGLEKIDIYAKHYEDKKMHGEGSHMYPSLADEGSYYGQKRSFQPMPKKTAEMATFNSAPAVDINSNVFADRDYAQIKASSGGRQRGVDLGAVLRKALVQKLDKVQNS